MIKWYPDCPNDIPFTGGLPHQFYEEFRPVENFIQLGGIELLAQLLAYAYEIGFYNVRYFEPINLWSTHMGWKFPRFQIRKSLIRRIALHSISQLFYELVIIWLDELSPRFVIFNISHSSFIPYEHMKSEHLDIDNQKLNPLILTILSQFSNYFCIFYAHWCMYVIFLFIFY